tara:strand:- start:91 stop:507 length:417 start_codon:yes stop_codon:yes gene_type:complete
MERICSKQLVKELVTQDPVRPHISADARLAPGREIYHLDYKAYLCLGYMDRVPPDEECLLSANCGSIAVAYTVWSLEKGMGRKIILQVRDMIQDTWRFRRLVTLSPQTEMAMKFHLSNGAKLIAENIHSNNFEYPIDF